MIPLEGAAKLRVKRGDRVGETQWITFQATERLYNVLVETRHLDGGYLKVRVTEARGDDVMIELPRAGASKEWIAVVPSDTVFPDRGRMGRVGLLVFSAWVVLTGIAAWCLK